MGSKRTTQAIFDNASNSEDEDQLVTDGHRAWHEWNQFMQDHYFIVNKKIATAQRSRVDQQSSNGTNICIRHRSIWALRVLRSKSLKVIINS